MTWRPKEPPSVGDTAASASAKGDGTVRFDLSGGIDRSRAPNELPENACRLMQNLYYPRESYAPVTRPGAVAFSAAGGGNAGLLPGRITAFHTYTKSTSQSYLIVACMNASDDGQELWAADLTSAAPVPFQILASVGSTAAPTFKTLNARLLVAVAGQYLREWSGALTANGHTPAKATGSAKVASNPANGDWVTIGNTTYTFYDDAVVGRLGEVQIGGTAAATATNLKAAVDEQSWDVRCTEIDTDDVTLLLEVRATGSAGNSTACTAGQASITATTFSGGDDGLALDLIDSHNAPKGGIILGDKNGRVVVSGCTLLPDRVYFSAPGNAYDWNIPDLGAGRVWDMGYSEGNVVTAVVPYYDELWAHKRGQDREVYRARIADPTPGTWELQWRPHEEVRASMNARSAVTVGGKHVVLDSNYIGVYTGDDTYNEVGSLYDGSKVHDLFQAAAAGAFIAVNPAELYALIFRQFGESGLVYHYGSGRWTTWKFGFKVGAAHYCEPIGKFLVGSDDGYIYKLDDTVATDAGRVYESVVVTRTIDGGTSRLVVKQSIFDYQHIVSGSGVVQAIADRVEGSPKTLSTFAIQTVGTQIADATMEVYDATGGFSSSSYSRVVSDEQANGTFLALRLVFNGAARINSAIAKIAGWGRTGE